MREEEIVPLFLENLEREEKKRRENEAAGDSPKVEFREVSWERRREESLEEIRSHIDRWGESKEPARGLQGLSPTEERVLRSFFEGEVLDLEVLYRTRKGVVVRIEGKRKGKTETLHLLIVEEGVVPVEEVERIADALGGSSKGNLWRRIVRRILRLK